MSEKRMMAFEIHVENSDGTTKVKEFRRAISDTDDTVAMLNNELAENVTVTAKMTTGEKEALAQARQLVTQNEKRIKQYQSVTAQYTQYIKSAHLSAEAQEIFNAQVRAGVDPLSKEGKAIAELVKKHQSLRSAGDATRSSFRNLRGVSQNLGWQLQDVAVQAQMGTDAFVIISQQGSQMAAAFGAWGAIIGAGIAIAGAAIPALIAAFSEAEVSTEELEAAQKQLDDTFESSKFKLSDYSEELKELAIINGAFAKTQLEVARASAKTGMEGSVDAINQVSSALNDLSEQEKERLNEEAALAKRSAFVLTNSTLNTLRHSEAMTEVTNKYGIAQEEAKKLAEQLSNLQETGDPTEMAAFVATLTSGTEEGEKALLELQSTLANSSLEWQKYAEQLKLAEDGLKNGVGEPTDDIIKGLEDQIKTLGLTEEALKLYTTEQEYNTLIAKANTEAGKEYYEKQKERALELVKEYYKEEAAVEANTKALEDRKKAVEQQEEAFNSQKENLQAMTLKYETLTAAIGKTKEETAKLTLEQSYNQAMARATTDEQRLGIVFEYESAKEAMESYFEAEAKHEAERSSIKSTQNETKKQSAIVEKLIADQEKVTRTIEQEYERRKQIVEDNAVSQEQEVRGMAAVDAWYTDQLEDEAEKQAAILTKNQEKINKLRKTLNKDKFDNDPIGEEFEQHDLNLSNINILEQTALEAFIAGETDGYDQLMDINKLIEEENARHNQAIYDAQLESAEIMLSNFGLMADSMTTTLDLIAEGGSAIEEEMADMNSSQKAMFIVTQTLAAAMALVNGMQMGSELAKWAATYDPTGTASAAWMAAGTSMGAAQAGAIMGVTFAGAFDEGGHIPQGSVGIVSEYADELVNGVLVRGPADVTSSADTARIMDSSSSSGGSSGQQINQYITVSGTGDKALETAMKQAAAQGAKEGYSLVQNDINTHGTIRKQLKKSIGA